MLAPDMASTPRSGDHHAVKSTIRMSAQFLRSPRSIGSLVPSSRELAEVMIAPVDFAKGPVVVEFGPGTGPITGPIAERLTNGARYIGIELNPHFYDDLRSKFPHLTFINGSASDLGAILKTQGVDKVDAVICGLPWASLPVAVQPVILDEIDNHLLPGGKFVSFAYISGLALPAAWKFRAELKRRFKKVEFTRVVWRNIPPAFAYVCTR